MFDIRPLDEKRRPWAHDLIDREWGSPGIVTRGRLHDTAELNGFVAVEDKEPIGLVTFTIDKDECEIVSLNSLKEKRGVGLSLVDVVVKEAKANRCHRVVVITTNDNTNALHFYQKRGFHIRAAYPNALVDSRKLKPTIPQIGIDGIPLRDEIELEKLF